MAPVPARQWEAVSIAVRRPPDKGGEADPGPDRGRHRAFASSPKLSGCLEERCCDAAMDTVVASAARDSLTATTDESTTENRSALIDD